MEKNQRKRLIIIFAYLALAAVFSFFVYSLFSPKESCFDGIKNQNEDGVDCGGSCRKKCDRPSAQELVIGRVGFVESGMANKFDLYAEVINPNNTFGSSEFQYQFILRDSSDNVLAEKSAAGFVLPGEKKYIIENNVEANGIPANAEFYVKSSQWVESADYYEKPRLKIVNKNYKEISSGVGFAEASGLLKNESPFDFSRIRIKIILKGSEGAIVALNSTEMRTVKSGENREFKVFWPNKIPGSVADMEVQPEVNIFESESFATRYFSD